MVTRGASGTWLGLAAALAVGGCFGGGFETDEALVPLARADGHRADVQATTDHLLEIAYDRATAERAWRENAPDESVSSSSSTGPGLYGDLADVDFETQALVVWSSGDAGGDPRRSNDAAQGWRASA